MPVPAGTGTPWHAMRTRPPGQAPRRPSWPLPYSLNSLPTRSCSAMRHTRSIRARTSLSVACPP
ncbi:Uncharacterised protein [Bordetella pertussis]|nr:Uncharacterised protein [Bordetella pertussis]